VAVITFAPVWRATPLTVHDVVPVAVPLSDQQVVKMLGEKGISIARRTVAKYRDELGILPSNLRKVY